MISTSWQNWAFCVQNVDSNTEIFHHTEVSSMRLHKNHKKNNSPWITELTLLFLTRLGLECLIEIGVKTGVLKRTKVERIHAGNYNHKAKQWTRGIPTQRQLSRLRFLSGSEHSREFLNVKHNTIRSGCFNQLVNRLADRAVWSCLKKTSGNNSDNGCRMWQICLSSYALPCCKYIKWTCVWSLSLWNWVPLYSTQCDEEWGAIAFLEVMMQCTLIIRKSWIT